MLRLMLFGTAMLAIGSATAADLPQSDNTIYGKTPRHGRVVVVEEKSDLLFTPLTGAFPALKGAFPEIHLPPGGPILLGSATLPGYYGSAHSYEYQGPYYGGTSPDFRVRLPYACGVLGYYCD